MIKEFLKTAGQNWKRQCNDQRFSKKVIAGFLALLIILGCFPFFFHYIEQRPGYLLNDWLLLKIPVYNFSVPIFILIWSTALVAIVTAIKDPQFLLHFLFAYCLLCIFRYCSISLIPLEAPTGLIPLADPLSNLAYGNSTFITKDLFFSGHTSTLILIALCLSARPAKYFAFMASFFTGIFLLIQHVHYTIDILTAPFFAYIVYLLAGKLVTIGEKKAD